MDQRRSLLLIVGHFLENGLMKYSELASSVALLRGLNRRAATELPIKPVTSGAPPCFPVPE